MSLIFKIIMGTLSELFGNSVINSKNKYYNLFVENYIIQQKVHFDLFCFVIIKSQISNALCSIHLDYLENLQRVA